MYTLLPSAKSDGPHSVCFPSVWFSQLRERMPCANCRTSRDVSLIPTTQPCSLNCRAMSSPASLPWFRARSAAFWRKIQSGNTSRRAAARRYMKLYAETYFQLGPVQPHFLVMRPPSGLGLFVRPQAGSKSAPHLPHLAGGWNGSLSGWAPFHVMARRDCFGQNKAMTLVEATCRIDLQDCKAQWHPGRACLSL
jgi:hypothetical protein